MTTPPPPAPPPSQPPDTTPCRDAAPPAQQAPQPGLHRVLLLGGATFTAADGVTVLQAALAAGIALRSSCRNGTCRACLSHLRSGTIAYQIEWPGVSLEEKQTGYFLPCVACATSDLVVEQAP